MGYNVSIDIIVNEKTMASFRKDRLMFIMIILYQENGLGIETGPRGPSDIYAVLSWKGFHDKENTVSLLFYLYNGNSYTRKDGPYLDTGVQLNYQGQALFL